MNARKFFKSDRMERSMRLVNNDNGQRIIEEFESCEPPIPEESKKRSVSDDESDTDSVPKNNDLDLSSDEDEEQIDHQNEEHESSGFQSQDEDDEYHDLLNVENEVDEYDLENADMDFEPIFNRCSTPNREFQQEQNSSFRYHYNDSFVQALNQTYNRPKVNLWDQALNQNDSLREWIEEFNKHIEMVDKSKLSIKYID